MHMADLGITQYCIGNILVELFVELGGSFTRPISTMGTLVALLKDAANDLSVSCPVSSLTLSHIRREDNKCPVLKLKAAKTREFVPIVLRLLEAHFPATSERERVRYHCLRHLNDMYNEFKAWGDDSPKRVAEMLRRHEMLYMRLGREQIFLYGAQNWVKWRWYPKHHMMCHLTREQTVQYGSPACYWNYSDERSIGHAVQIAESTHVSTLSDSTILKYMAEVWDEMHPSL